jgi:hypothetical protein
MGLLWDAVPNSTRHTALTDFGAAGANAFTVQQIAGTRLRDHVAEIHPFSAGDDSASHSTAGGIPEVSAQRPNLSSLTGRATPLHTGVRGCSS